MRSVATDRGITGEYRDGDGCGYLPANGDRLTVYGYDEHVVIVRVLPAVRRWEAQWYTPPSASWYGY